jgi:hypothetical protein
VLLSTPTAALGKDFHYRGKFKGEPQSSVHFTVKANRTGAQVSEGRHLSFWEWPEVCSGNPVTGIYVLSGPFAVAGNELLAHVVLGDQTVDIEAKFKLQGGKATGTFEFDETTPAG